MNDDRKSQSTEEDIDLDRESFEEQKRDVDQMEQEMEEERREDANLPENGASEA